VPKVSDRPCILIDSREKAELRFSGAVDTETVLLPVGDYSLRGATDSVVIERKRGGELQSCCGTDRERFIEQIERMRSYPVRHLVIEATVDDIVCGVFRSRIAPLSVIGTLAKFTSDWQIPCWFCGDAKTTALVVERILMREFKRLQLGEKHERTG
jgi:ERCC4-type nuclease